MTDRPADPKTTPIRRPENGDWCVRHWMSQIPHDIELHGQFTAGELRWLADALDRHNAEREADAA